MTSFFKNLKPHKVIINTAFAKTVLQN